MNYRLFQYPLPAPPELDDLNAFLASHRVASVSQQIVQSPSGAMLLFIVQTVEARASAASPSEARVDYKEVLSPEDFRVFSRLREVRKQLAQEEGVPIYSIFTNAQLAAMVTQRVKTPAAMAAIDGIGQARVQKHGSRLLAALVTEPAHPGAETKA